MQAIYTAPIPLLMVVGQMERFSPFVKVPFRIRCVLSSLIVYDEDRIEHNLFVIFFRCIIVIYAWD